MNMRPPEILSLLEEASGTKLYERKKEGALRTLSKKQTKLDEIDQVRRGWRAGDAWLPSLPPLPPRGATKLPACGLGLVTWRAHQHPHWATQSHPHTALHKPFAPASADER